MSVVYRRSQQLRGLSLAGAENLEISSCLLSQSSRQFRFQSHKKFINLIRRLCKFYTRSADCFRRPVGAHLFAFFP
jgi:hypothetical protein